MSRWYNPNTPTGLVLSRRQIGERVRAWSHIEHDTGNGGFTEGRLLAVGSDGYCSIMAGETGRCYSRWATLIEVLA